MIVGGIMIALFAYRLFKSINANNRGLLPAVTGLLGGTILAVIGSSRFWNGYELEIGSVLFSFLNVEIVAVSFSV